MTWCSRGFTISAAAVFQACWQHRRPEVTPRCKSIAAPLTQRLAARDMRGYVRDENRWFKWEIAFMSPAEACLKEAPSDMTDAEWTQRINLAACYRLVAHYGWDDLVDTHISARVPGPEHHFLINPYGLMFDEITASSLVKVDLDGNQLTESPYSINPAGFTN